MSAPLEARLLGDVSFHVGAEDVTPRSRKQTALLALLTLRPAGVRRDVLAEMIWPPGKLASLRQALYELRKLPGADVWLNDDSDLVRLNVTSDVAAFEHAVEHGDSATAVALWSGELLADQPDLDAPAYREWVTDNRQRLSELALRAYARETVRLESAGDLETARRTVREALTLDPLDETLYRAAMRIAYGLGDAGAAGALYDTCVRVLAAELGQQPGDETRTLAERIERGEPASVKVDVHALAGERQRLVWALAVADGSLGVTELATVLERREFDLAEDLATLERGGVVNRHLTVTAGHVEAVKSSLPDAVRRLLHERVAAALLADPDPDDAAVARHLLAAGDASQAAPRLVAAAQSAIDAGEVEPAIELLMKAAWAAYDLPRVRLEAYLLLEGAASQHGDKDLQDAALDEAERLAWDQQVDESIAEARMRRSRQQLVAGNIGEGLERALEALEIANRVNDESLAARARNAVGGAHYYAGDLDGAAAVFGANLQSPNLIERYRAHSNLGSLAAMRGDLDGAYPHFESALTLARSVGPKADIAATLNNLAATAERVGAYTKAVKHFKDAIELARKNQVQALEGRMLVNLAVVYARLGELGPAWNTAGEVEELADRLDDPRLRLSAVELKADVLRSCGMLFEAGAAMSEAHQAAVAMGDERKAVSLEAQARTIESVIAGDPEDAVGAITAVEEARLTDVAAWLWLELALAARDASSAIQYLGRVGRDQVSVHQGAVVDIATVRAGLLADADGACLEAADAAAARLEGPADRAWLDDLQIVERPYGRFLLAARAHAGDPVQRAHASRFNVPQDVLTEVDEQAGGLPRAMATSLRDQPRAWLALMDQ